MCVFVTARGMSLQTPHVLPRSARSTSHLQISTLNVLITLFLVEKPLRNILMKTMQVYFLIAALIDQVY